MKDLLKEIKIGDIVLLKTVEQYEEDGEELTELVEMFAGQYFTVKGIDKELNDFGEKVYTVVRLNDENFGILSVTDHEIAQVFRGVEE